MAAASGDTTIDEARDLFVASLQQCRCHCREEIGTCPRRQSRLGGLDGSSETPVMRVLKELQKQQPTSKKASTDALPFGVSKHKKSELVTYIKSSLACPTCQETCADWLGQLLSDPSLSRVIEVSDPSKPEKPLQWILTADPEVPDNFVCRLCVQRKKRELMKAEDIRAFLKRRSGRFKVAASGDTEEEVISSFIDALSLNEITWENVEQALALASPIYDTIRAGIAYRQLFHRDTSVVEEVEFAQLRDACVGLIGACQIRHDDNDILGQMYGQLRKVGDVFLSQNMRKALYIGLQVSVAAIPSTTSYILDTLNPENCFLACAGTLKDTFASDTSDMSFNQYLNNALSLLDEIKVLGNKTFEELAECRPLLKQLLNDDLSEARRFVLASTIPASNFAAAVQGLRDAWEKNRHHLVRSIAQLGHVAPTIKVKFQVMFLMSNAALLLDDMRKELGAMDWYLAQIASSKDPQPASKVMKCLATLSDTNFALDHALGKRLLNDAIAWIDARDRDSEAERQRQQAMAETATKELFADENKPKKKSQQKKKAKENSTIPARSVPEESKNTIVEEEKVAAVVGSKSTIPDTPMSTEVQQIAASEESFDYASFITEESFQDEGEWEPVDKGKEARKRNALPAPSTTSSGKKQNSLIKETWQGRTKCEVTIPGRKFGLVIGERGSNILAMEKESGCKINAVSNSAGREQRSFTVQGPTNDAVRRAIQLIRDRVEGTSSRNQQPPRIIEISKATADKIAGNNGKLAKEIESETGCAVSVRHGTTQGMKAVYLSGKQGNIEKAAARIEALEKSGVTKPNPSTVKETPPAKQPGVVEEVSCPECSDNVVQSAALELSSPEEDVAVGDINGTPDSTETPLVEPVTETPDPVFVAPEPTPVQISSEDTEMTPATSDVKSDTVDVVETAPIDEQEELIRKDEALARALHEEELNGVKDAPRETTSSTPATTHAPPVQRPASQPLKEERAQVRLKSVRLPSVIRGEWDPRSGVLNGRLPVSIAGRIVPQLTNIQRKTDTRIDMKDDHRDSRERTFTIRSSSESRAQETLRLLRKELGEQESFEVPKEAQERVFATRSFTRMFEDASGCRIIFDSARDKPHRIITVLGTPSNIARCRFLWEHMSCGAHPDDALKALKNHKPGTPFQVWTTVKSGSRPTLTAATAVQGMRGLSNQRGENSCFLNVVVQALFHFSSFSDKMVQQMETHPRCRAQEDPRAKCIVCALLNTFKALKSDEGLVVSSAELREAVADAFEGKFDLGKMEDAAEAFEKVLDEVHNCIAENPDAGEEIACNCLVHQCFSSFIFEGLKCPTCLPLIAGNRFQSDPALVKFAEEGNKRVNAMKYKLMQTMPQYECLVRYIPAFSVALSTQEEVTAGMPFEEVVSNIMSPAPRSCPACEKGSHPTVQLATQVPTSVFSLALTWMSESPDYSTEVAPVLDSITEHFDIGKVAAIHITRGRDSREVPTYPSVLRGLICFNRKHYVAFFRKRTSSDWFEFDDTRVKAVARTWKEAREVIKLAKFQPVVLFYEVRNPI